MFGGFKFDPSKLSGALSAVGGGFKDLDGGFGKGNLAAAQEEIERQKQVAHQKQLLAQATQGLTPQQKAFAQLNPQAFSSAQINNQFQDPLKVQAAQQAQQRIDNQASQFGVTSAQGQQRIDNQANQFGVTSAQGQQRIDNQASQFGQSNQLAQDKFGFQQGQAGIQNDFKESEALRNQGNADRTAGLSQQRLSQQGAEASQFGLTPVFGRDENGNRVLIQTNKSGGVRQAQLPDGLTLEDDRFKAQSRTEGTEQGKAVANLPSALNNATRTLDTVDHLLNHPGLSAGTGKSAILPAIPGTQRKAFDVANKQLNGQVFLQGFEALKGGGVITEIEGLKAEQALARANQAQSQEDYTVALQDYTSIVAGGIDAAHQRAGKETPKRFLDILNKGNSGSGLSDAETAELEELERQFGGQ